MRNYADEAYTNWRKLVRKRDKQQCRMPGCKARKFLQVHHIRPWSKFGGLRYEVNNGITLCKFCHKNITGKEHFYVQLFEEIIHG